MIATHSRPRSILFNISAINSDQVTFGIDRAVLGEFFHDLDKMQRSMVAMVAKKHDVFKGGMKAISIDDETGSYIPLVDTEDDDVTMRTLYVTSRSFHKPGDRHVKQERVQLRPGVFLTVRRTLDSDVFMYKDGKCRLACTVQQRFMFTRDDRDDSVEIALDTDMVLSFSHFFPR